MKGVLLAGGTGSRLRPITHTGPKQLVPIANKPVLEYAIDDLRDAGITEIGVVLGEHGRNEIQAFLGDGNDFGVEIAYIVQGEPLGLAHAIGCARDFVADDPFVVYLGDNLLRDGITEMVSEFDPETYSAGIGVQAVAEPTQFGVVDLDETGDVRQLVEKPDDPPSDLALIGVYIFRSEIFEQIERLSPSWRGEYEITEAIQGLLDDGSDIASHRVDGWWKDTGKPEDVLHANHLILDGIKPAVEGTVETGASITGRIHLADGSTIEDGAVVRGPVSIDSNVVIGSDAYIGPYTSIGEGTKIENAHVESSVVIGDAEINVDAKIVDSLVGSNTSIEDAANEKPSGNRLVIGEHSNIQL